MNLTESQNRKIAEWLGICWHEFLPQNGSFNFGDCSCGVVINIYHSEWKAHPGHRPPPPFDSRDGFFLIIEEGPKQKEWWGFVKASGCFLFKYNDDDASLQVGLGADFVGPALAGELSRWLEGRE